MTLKYTRMLASVGRAYLLLTYSRWLLFSRSVALNILVISGKLTIAVLNVTDVKNRPDRAGEMAQPLKARLTTENIRIGHIFSVGPLSFYLPVR